MGKTYKKFTRLTGTRPYRKSFHIFPEGSKTEPQYFEMLKRQCLKVHLNIKADKTKTDPHHILERAKKFVKNEEFKSGDKIWIVIDIDNRKKEQFQALFQWSEEAKNHGLATSNPNFEYWLLMHFEKGNNIRSIQDCGHRLRKHMPNYKKNRLDLSNLEDNIKVAIENAESKSAQCKNWYKEAHSSVYVLIKEILDIENGQ